MLSIAGQNLSRYVESYSEVLRLFQKYLCVYSTIPRGSTNDVIRCAG